MKPSDFATVFEVSIAIHLAYTLLSDVRHSTLQRFRDSVQYVKDYIYRFERAKISVERLELRILQFEEAWLKAWFALRPLIRFFSIISVVVALFSLGVLIFAGFQPKRDWSVSVMVTVLSFVLLPMPLFLLVTRLAARRYIKNLNGLVDAVLEEQHRLSEEYSKSNPR